MLMRLQPHGTKQRVICLSPSICLHCLQEYESDKYSVLWYKHDKAIGIRQKFGAKKQIWSFRSAALEEKDLRLLGDECLNRLDLGKSEKDVHDWVKRALSDWPDFQD